MEMVFMPGRVPRPDDSARSPGDGDVWRRSHEMTEGTWRVLRRLVDWVTHNWHLPDSSL